MSDRAKLGRRSRAKGQEYERRIARLLTEAMPGTRWQRNVQTRGAARDGVADIVGYDADGEQIPLWIECHNGQTPLEEKLRQGQRDAPDSYLVVAIVHRPGTPYTSDLAAMGLGTLLGLIGRGRADEGGETIIAMSARTAIGLIATWHDHQEIHK